MGQMEVVSKKRQQKNYIQQAILGTIGVTGILAASLIAPNALQVLPHLMGKKRYKLAFEARTAIKRLEIKGHIKWVERRGKRYAEITAAGRRALALAKARTQPTIPTKKRWDRRYRMVIFDIPERRKKVREKLRRMMVTFGFFRLQDSVWISPYDCEDVIALIKAELQIGKDVLYIIADTIENDAWIRRHFGLKN